MKLLSGRDEITGLMKKVFKKYELETHKEIITKKTLTHYDVIAHALNEAKYKYENPGKNREREHGKKSIDNDHNEVRRISPGQVREAWEGHVENPKPYLVDACYIYLFNVNRELFEKDPTDSELVDHSIIEVEDYISLTNEKQITETELLMCRAEKEILAENISVLEKKNAELADSVSNCQGEKKRSQSKLRKSTIVLVCLTLVLITLGTINLMVNKNEWANEKKDLDYKLSRWDALKQTMAIMPHSPTQKEIDSISGIWLVYTPSPQARSSDKDRYHMIACNVVDIKYNNGYFIYTRYGARFDHEGFIQFEAPWLISIHSHIKKEITDSVESPRYSLMRLNTKGYINAISASWNFDIKNKNLIIGNRELYRKIGKTGLLKAIYNDPDYKFKLIEWYHDNVIEKIPIQNQWLDTLPVIFQEALNEKSIILLTPKDGIVLAKSVVKNDKKL